MDFCVVERQPVGRCVAFYRSFRATLPIFCATGLALAAGLPTAGAQDRLQPGVVGSPFDRAPAESDQRPARPVRLASATIDTSALSPALAEVADDDALVSRPRIVQLDGPMTPERAARLAAAGVKVGEYLSENAFVMRLDGADRRALRELDFVRWNGAFQSGWKLDPGLGRREFATQARKTHAERGEVAVSVWLFKGEDAAEAERRIGAIPGAGATRIEASGDQRYIRVSLPQDRVADLAAIDEVRFVEEYPEATLRNGTARWIVQTNVAGATPLYDYGLRGEGQIIGIIDGLVNIAHCSFSDIVPVGPAHRKVVAYNAPQGSDAHGTHVAGTALGDGGADNDTRGVAYLAKMAFNNIPSFTSNAFLSRLNTHHSQGARIHNNSWGADFRIDYNVWCREADLFSWENEEDLVIFAITNRATLYTPENAKNVLAVGATESAPNQSLHGSGGVGPTFDGRRKPEVYAPGVASYSASSHTSCGTLAFTGTSMAAPAVSGIAALVREYFMKGFYPSGAANPADSLTPSGALVRAVIVNSSVDLTGVAGYPSNLEGWGRVLINNTLYFPGDDRTLLVWDERNSGPGALSTGGENSHTFFVTAPGEQLRVTMAFTDAPATVGAVFTPVNNLDLQVVSPTGAVYRGNVFDTTAQGVATGDSAANRFYNPGAGVEFDPVNNIEQVHVDDAPVGQWTITVRAAAVNVGQQGYALVVSGAVEGEAVCSADLNGDGQVTGADLALLLTDWGFAISPADLNHDGTVNSMDLGILLTSWGACD